MSVDLLSEVTVTADLILSKDLVDSLKLRLVQWNPRGSDILQNTRCFTVDFSSTGYVKEK